MPQKPRKPYHHPDLRSALLSAARQVFRSTAPEDLSLRALARACGVSHAAPYRHFPGGERDLLRVLAREGFDSLVERLQGVANEEDFASRYCDWAVSNVNLFRLMFAPRLWQADPDAPLIGDAVLETLAADEHLWCRAHGAACLQIEEFLP